MARPKYSKLDIVSDEIQAKLKAGCTLKQIADSLGVSPQSVNYWMGTRGIARPDKKYKKFGMWWSDREYVILMDNIKKSGLKPPDFLRKCLLKGV